MIRAAGILYVTKDSRALFLQRAGGADFAGSWCIPGGKLEDEESAEQAARREAAEEAGAAVPKGELALLTRTIRPAGSVALDLPEADLSTVAVPGEQVDFTTFIQFVDEPFDVAVDAESTGFAWAPLDAAPEPLHPGCRIALDRLAADELGVARMMAAGTLVSPQFYQNVGLFDLRITGTGVAWRSGDEQFTMRDPQHYLTDEFLARCAGLPVLWEHPKKALLTGKEWNDRAIGTVFLPYIKGDEVWAIAKIYDAPAIKVMSEEQLSTSPCVNLLGSDSQRLILENGSVVLIEGKPSLLDHVAVCEVGVWDKGGEPTGVNTVKADSDMTDEEKAKLAAEEKARADAVKADSDFKSGLTSFMESMKTGFATLTSKLDSVKADVDALKAQPDASKKDDEETEEEKKAREKREEKEKDDKAKKDAAAKKDDEDSEEEKERKRKEREKDDAAKADAAIEARVAKHLAAILPSHLPKPLTDADRALFATIQAKADSVYQAHNKKASRPMDGETPLAYRRRMAEGLQPYSKKWKDIPLAAFADNEQALALAEDQIYADAMVAAHNPTDLAAGELRQSIAYDEMTGRRTISWKGQPSSWMGQFQSEPLKLVGINRQTAH